MSYWSSYWGKKFHPASSSYCHTYKKKSYKNVYSSASLAESSKKYSSLSLITTNSSGTNSYSIASTLSVLVTDVVLGVIDGSDVVVVGINVNADEVIDDVSDLW